MTLKQLWKDGAGFTGIWSGLNDPVAIELIGRSGFDFVSIDLQHSHGDLAGVGPLLAALERTPSASVVRVPWNRPELIMRALDLGAEGVIVPMVSSVQEAQEAAAACRYAPGGIRSWGPVWDDARRVSPQPPEGDDIATCIVMIETQGGFADVEGILAVPGVDAAYIGPNDLSLSLGWERKPATESPELDAAIQRIIDAGRAAGKPVGLDCRTPEEALAWRERGLDWTICWKDSSLLKASSEAAAATLRAGGA